MMINIGDKIPNSTCMEFGSKGIEKIKIGDYVKDKKVVIFAVVGAFTPLCSNDHLPGYVKNYDAFKKKGIDEIICISVNDPFVMAGWAKIEKVDHKLTMLSDWNADFTKSMGLTFDATALGLGIRSQRYSALVEKGILKLLEVEVDPKMCTVSGANVILQALED